MGEEVVSNVNSHDTFRVKRETSFYPSESGIPGDFPLPTTLFIPTRIFDLFT